ncbi:MAG TPA: hypothetical protein VGB73_17435 [Pyrinomonadaceae bacterium]
MFVGFIYWSKGEPACVAAATTGEPGSVQRKPETSNTRAARTRRIIERAHAPLFT